MCGLPSHRSVRRECMVSQEAGIRTEGTRPTGVSSQRRPSSLRTVTHSGRSRSSTGMFGWQDLSPRSRPNTKPLTADYPQNKSRTGCKAGSWGTQCGQTQKRPVCMDSKCGKSKLQRWQTQLLTALRSGCQVLLRTPGIMTSLGSKDTQNSIINMAPLCFRKLKLTLTEMVNDNYRGCLYVCLALD